ncbi:hypothetical protein P0L94_11870 [Microbacter sp. GSS18]|nr:hypothetical protein P0L94_11870 [Microbacter sp. GSS18]
MSIALSEIPVLSGRRVIWEQDAGKRHVASLNGDVVGLIDRNADGSFVAFDDRTTPIGRYATLREAKRSVGDVARGAAATRSERLTRVAQPLASATGIISVALLVAAGAEAVLPIV